MTVFEGDSLHENTVFGKLYGEAQSFVAFNEGVDGGCA
jgi:hypothetical protein